MAGNTSGRIRLPTNPGANTNALGRTMWNDKTRSDLLLAIIDHAPPTPAQWEKIIEQLNGQGYVYSHTAALQHLQKLKRKDKDGAGAGANGSAGSVPSTPKKGAKGGAAKNGGGSRSTTGGRKRTTRPDPVDFESAANDDDDEPDTPARKKVKATPAPANKGQLEEDEPAPPADGEEI
ncbi:hypothetical protein F5Y15DRAFT_413846 [Xylariaceae sp. FL0016]|nr:hypothetical protein F5Y15DRAFT_413846 [Xylariaceae sp. FL0016]